MRTVRVGQGLFAIGAASLALWSLEYGHFAWQSVPTWIPWRETWVYGSSLILLAAGIGLCFARTALPSVLTIGAYLLVVTVLSLPGALAGHLGVGESYPLCEGLTSVAGAWILYALMQRESQVPVGPIAGKRALYAAQAVFGLTCVFYGWSHFVYADYTATLVPAWLPGRLPLAYFTGIGHIAAGVAIIIGILPGLAATLEAVMMSLFGLLVWMPTFFAHPRPQWATPPAHQWSELVVTLLMAASAWIVAISFWKRLAGTTTDG